MSETDEMHCYECNKPFTFQHEHEYMTVVGGEDMSTPHCRTCGFDNGHCPGKHGYLCDDCAKEKPFLDRVKVIALDMAAELKQETNANLVMDQINRLAQQRADKIAKAAEELLAKYALTPENMRTSGYTIQFETFEGKDIITLARVIDYVEMPNL